MISIYLNSHWKKWHSVIFFFKISKYWVTKPRQPHTVPPESRNSKLSERTPSGRQPGATEGTIRDSQRPMKCPRHFAPTRAKSWLRQNEKATRSFLVSKPFPAHSQGIVDLSRCICLSLEWTGEAGGEGTWHFLVESGEGMGSSIGKGDRGLGD